MRNFDNVTLEDCMFLFVEMSLNTVINDGEIVDFVEV